MHAKNLYDYPLVVPWISTGVEVEWYLWTDPIHFSGFSLDPVAKTLAIGHSIACIL